MNPEFLPAVPEVPVAYIDEALSFYTNKLGFTHDWGDEELGLAGISKGECRLFLASSEYRAHRGNVGPALIWLNFTSNDEVNDVHRIWSANGVKIVSGPESKPWGLHEFTAIDLDGNLFRVFHDFGTSERARAASTQSGRP